MFSLCKTVKIYQTINHYHNEQNLPHVDSHELNYSENLIPNSKDIALKTIQSHNISHSKTRTGISVSIKKPSSLSPRKKYHNQRHNSDMIAISHQLNYLQESKSKQTQFNSIKLRTTNRYDNDSPLFVESKITYGEMSPKIQICQPLQTRFTLPQSELPLFTEIPLRKELTRTTQQSMRKSEPKIEINISPLKKSAVFLRNNNNKQQHSQTIKNSMMQSSVKNSIDFRLSTSKIKSKDITESLLKLSSSFSQIMDKPNNELAFDQFSRTCSLQLKKDDHSGLLRRDQSGFLKQYVCQVNESIIMEKQNNTKQLKIVKSNNDLLHKHSPQDFKPSLSNIIDREDSPVKRLKKRYGENLLNPYDKETIVSKSFVSKSNYYFQKKQIIDQSVIIQHQIEANKFIPLKERTLNRQFFSMYLAVESTAHILVSIKELPINRIDKINNELTIYREIQSIEAGISQLYQMYTHGTSYILIKEPYEYTLHEFIDKNSEQYVLISWQFITRSIEQMIKNTVLALQKKKFYLTKLISVDDLVYVFGEWKLHSPDMFSHLSTQKASIQLEQAMQLLKQQILGRIRERKILN